MFLLREDVSKYIFRIVNWEAMPTQFDASNDEKKNNSQQKKYDISANDAIREDLVLYESLGKLRVEEASFTNFQLACYHRDYCLKALNLEGK